jgi:hypothetical protein
MSLSQLQELQTTGVHVIVVRGSVTDYRNELKDAQPRGYPKAGILECPSQQSQNIPMNGDWP